ncbi:3-hydroxyacyl-CoA dehydrogenase [Fontimonas thermophila]|uniref:3-hydroxyacyl-CoA dehydrogenase n=1 Tax=Fontimonas thermophila TaxID=1076937 RepID=A0A1I2JS05_9GAMM|nr:3-hydroxyacyl-CoA dehydrogenase NAD-binding domain-containing protein [Fontimonas thermophila]SFF56753.1 3-hydroxyacyl-CoA dehydrogenase [Fontimonas thermophila]
MSVSHYRVHGQIAVIAMNHPPVNGLGLALRRALLDGLDRAEADPAVRAIVLIGTDKVFSAGADIHEFNSPLMRAEPTLHTLIDAIERGTKPVIAAIAGACMGGGLELALGCHFRIARADAQIALPEVKLGLLPGAGGTQRLPRAVGVETALNLIVSGATVPAQQLSQTALFDALVADDLASGALAFAEKILAEGIALKRIRDLPCTHPDAEAYFQFARHHVRSSAGAFPAPLKCIDAVAAAVTSPTFDAGLAAEREAFAYLVQTPESKALRHVFFAERAVTKIPDVPEDTPTRPIKTAAVIGAGTMGGGIAMTFANAGIPVSVLEIKAEALERGLATIRKNYESQVKKGKLGADALAARMALIQPTLDYAHIRDADIVIEAVFEDMDVKKAVFEKLDAVMKPGAILATNTSTLDVNRIAAFTTRPEDVVGTHFFSPANVMRLLEIVRGEKTAKDVLATVMKLAKTLKKLPVVAGVCDGFIGNRMIHRYSAEAMRMLLEGALPQQIDQAIERWGMAMGPFRMSDLAGNDVGWLIRKRHYAERPQMPRAVIADRLCERGRFGQKTGKGWYAYRTGDRTAYPDPEVEQLIVDARREAGIAPRRIDDGEIVERLIYALVNEGARILEEGIALRASDIDMVYLNGYGFPLHRGGPMFYADTVGLYTVARRMRAFARQPGADAAFWTPAPLLERLAAEGKTFN